MRWVVAVYRLSFGQARSGSEEHLALDLSERLARTYTTIFLGMMAVDVQTSALLVQYPARQFGVVDMRPFILVLLFVVLTLADAATTLYLNVRYPEGMELNPFINPGDWRSILFAPVKILIYSLFVGAVFICEINKSKLAAWHGHVPNIVMLAYLPLFLIAVKGLAIANNLMPILGVSTPVSYLLLWMESLPGDRESHYALIWSAIFLLLAPLGVRLVRWIY
jgi:hypothetical protein